jgi:hypothetical protein
MEYREVVDSSRRNKFAAVGSSSIHAPLQQTTKQFLVPLNVHVQKYQGRQQQELVR